MSSSFQERLERSMKESEKELELGRKIMVVVGIVNLIIGLGCFILLPLRFRTPEYLNFSASQEVRAQDDMAAAALIVACRESGGEWHQDFGKNNTGCSIEVSPDLSWYQIPLRNPTYPEAQRVIGWGMVMGCFILLVGAFLLFEGLACRLKSSESE